MANKYGVSMNGHIENTNKIKAIKCNCSICVHSKKYQFDGQTMIYCNVFKKNNPKNTTCKRYYPKDLTSETMGMKEKQKTREISSWEPSFPWERPLGGDKRRL